MLRIILKRIFSACLSLIHFAAIDKNTDTSHKFARSKRLLRCLDLAKGWLHIRANQRYSTNANKILVDAQILEQVDLILGIFSEPF